MINTLTQKKIFLETYGCQMNFADTEIIQAILAKENFAFVTDENEADIIMLNTCAIRENAHRKVYGRVHEILHKRKKAEAQFRAAALNSNSTQQRFLPAGKNSTQPENLPLIGILGCMATNLRKELFENRKLKIDFIAGPDSYKRLPELIREAAATGEKAYDVTLSEFETYSDIYPMHDPSTVLKVDPSTALKAKVNAWIAVSRGCNNFCTFCVVPYTRGRERSRSVANIVEECQRLAQDGFKQVTLLGQNVNSYHHENDDFADLLEAVSRINGIERIRFTSPHPKDFPTKLLEVVAHNPKVCKHVHLPLQAGNDRVLEMMNRTYTQAEFLALVDQTRRLIPNVALSTDVIVGFPTETDAEFEDTFKVMQTVEFDTAFTFKYSERKQTMAYRKFPDDVPESKKTERIMALTDLQKAIALKKNRAHIGQTRTILIDEDNATKAGGFYAGRTDGNHLVIIPQGTYKVGEMIDVYINEATPHALKGTPRH